MSLHYIIDGYNIINHPRFTSANKPSQEVRLALSFIIRKKGLTGSPKNKVTIVFDGYPPSAAPAGNDCGAELIYSRKISADEKIKMLIEQVSGRKEIIVVSDDRQVCQAAKMLGARALGVEEFFSAKENRRCAIKAEPLKQQLNYTQMKQINEELSRLWLKE